MKKLRRLFSKKKTDVASASWGSPYLTDPLRCLVYALICDEKLDLDKVTQSDIEVYHQLQSRIELSYIHEWVLGSTFVVDDDGGYPQYDMVNAALEGFSGLWFSVFMLAAILDRASSVLEMWDKFPGLDVWGMASSLPDVKLITVAGPKTTQALLHRETQRLNLCPLGPDELTAEEEYVMLIASVTRSCLPLPAPLTALVALFMTLPLQGSPVATLRTADGCFLFSRPEGAYFAYRSATLLRVGSRTHWSFFTFTPISEDSSSCVHIRDSHGQILLHKPPHPPDFSDEQGCSEAMTWEVVDAVELGPGLPTLAERSKQALGRNLRVVRLQNRATGQFLTRPGYDQPHDIDNTAFVLCRHWMR